MKICNPIQKIFMAVVAITFMALGISPVVQAQDTIRGQVVDARTGDSLPGVNILVQGTDIGVATNNEGEFELNVPSLQETLIITYIGYTRQEVALEGRTFIEIELEQEGIIGDELVVTALGIQRDRRQLGYSVQTLNSENLVSAPDQNIVNSLSGKIAGVQITDSGGQIGSSSRIVIRGNASFSGNQPLFVVDGVPIDNSSSNLGGAGGLDWGNTGADIRSEDIESITVLKGANAAALYGSRATHGVVLIETKKGDIDRASVGVNYTHSTSFDVPSYFHNLQYDYGVGCRGGEYDWQEWLDNNPGENLTYNEYAKQHSYNYVDGMGGGVCENSTSWGPRYDEGLLLDQWVKGPNTPYESNPDNITNNFFQTGSNINNQIEVSANGDQAHGRVSVSNQEITGTYRNTDQTVNSFQGNLTLTPNEKLNAGASFNYMNRSSDNIPQTSYFNPTFNLTNFSWGPFRHIPLDEVRRVYEENGNERGSGYNPNSDNFFFTVANNTNSMNRNRFFGNLNVNYQMNDWLAVSSLVGLDYYNEERKSVISSRTRSNISNERGGQFDLSNRTRRELNADVRIHAMRQLTSDISFDGMFGSNFRQDNYDQMSVSANDLTVPDLFTISNVEGTPGAGMYQSRRESASLYFTGTFDFRNYLFLEITGRNDWSSTLPADNRSYFYPSASLAFNVTDAFDFELNSLSYLQLRTSLAKVGSDTSPHQLSKTYGAGSFNQISLFNPAGTKPPQNLLPEESTSFEIGTDIRFLEDRFSLEATYYNQNTKDMILAVPVARSTGYASQLINAAEINNSGFEVIARGAIFPGFGRSFGWNTTLNFAINSSEIVSLHEDLESITINNGFGGARLHGQPGDAWGTIYGLPYLRDDNGNIVISSGGTPVTTSEAVPLGNVSPDWVGGIQNTFTYKSFQLGSLVDVKMGGDFFSTTMWHSYPTGSFQNSVKNNVREEGIIVEGVKEDGSPNDIRISAQDYFSGAWVWNNHEYSIIDGSFVKLRELTLGYDFGSVGPLHNLRLSAYGRNLAILYRSEKAREMGMDPEAASQMGGTESGTGFENFMPPTNRIYGFQLNISI